MQPGLAALPTVLGLTGLGSVRVPSMNALNVVLPGGSRERQLVRASPCYRWIPLYDDVAYPGVGAGEADAARLYGQIRLLLRSDEGDNADVARLVPADEDVGPLTERGCAQLRWGMTSDDVGGPADVRLDLLL